MQRLTQQYADGLLAIFPARAASMGKALGLAEERIQVDFSHLTLSTQSHSMRLELAREFDLVLWICCTARLLTS